MRIMHSTSHLWVSFSINFKVKKSYQTIFCPSFLFLLCVYRSIKFLAFERVCEAIYEAFPTLSETTVATLGVTLVAGALSGALSSVVSQPADSILTYVSKTKAANSNVGIVDGAMMMVKSDGVSSLYRGLGSRCVWA